LQIAADDRKDFFVLKEFKEFALRGNVLDLAVGVIIGAAFGKIVTSFVQDMLMPPISLLMGGADFTNHFIALNGLTYPTLAAAKAAGVSTINYGVFLNSVIDFLIVAFAVFLLVRQVNRVKKQEPAPLPLPSQKECPQCLMLIPVRAKKCGHCTAQLIPA
jgi:large conductance mechanosensitive channel